MQVRAARVPRRAHPPEDGSPAHGLAELDADLLLVDGDPIADIKLIEDPGKNFVVIMKDGKIYKIGRVYEQGMPLFGARAFNVAFYMPPLTKALEDWSGFPVVVHLVDRGDPANHTSDIGAMEAVADYQYAPLRIPPGTSRSAAATMLSLQADTGGWELARLQLHADGTRKVLPRCRFIRSWIKEHRDYQDLVDPTF